jgi:hydrogenase/urease accessory protein HupE
MRLRHPVRLLFLAALFVPGLALAHPGHTSESGFALGFAHPFDGLDHIAILVAAGLVVRRLGALGSASFLVGLLTLFLIGHADWITPGATGWGFIAGFLTASATLVGAGMSVVGVWHRLVRIRAAPSRASGVAARTERTRSSPP